MNKIFLFLINLYQKTFSKDHGNNSGFCKFTPSCSEYSKICFESFGFFKAFGKSFYRILRCNPFGKGGKDLP